MKDNVLIKAWNILYPILIYYVVSNVVMALLTIVLGISQTEYAGYYMMLQTIAAAVSIPALMKFFRADRMIFTVFQQRTINEYKEIKRKEKILNAVLTFVGGALAGLVLNHLISVTGLTETSSAYQEITNHFYAGGIVFEILGVGVLVPIVEELLYRGIVYGRLSDWVGLWPAAIVSAVIFGALHFNVVQFIYASLMGLLLVYFLEKTHNLSGAILAHMGANLFTVIRTETGFLDFVEKSPVIFWIFTIITAIIFGGIIFILQKKDKRSGT